MGQASIPSLHGLLKIKDHIKDETYNLDGMSWELEVLFLSAFNYVHVVTGIGIPRLMFYHWKFYLVEFL